MGLKICQYPKKAFFWNIIKEQEKSLGQFSETCFLIVSVFPNVYASFLFVGVLATSKLSLLFVKVLAISHAFLSLYYSLGNFSCLAFSSSEYWQFSMTCERLVKLLICRAHLQPKYTHDRSTFGNRCLVVLNKIAVLMRFDRTALLNLKPGREREQDGLITLLCDEDEKPRRRNFFKL